MMTDDELATQRLSHIREIPLVILQLDQYSIAHERSVHERVFNMYDDDA